MKKFTDSKQGPTLVLVPGLLCDRTSWTPVIERLAWRGKLRVADLSTQASIGAMAADTLRGCDGQLWVAGHSMGARVAMEMARMAPGRIAGLALMDTGYDSFKPGEVERRRQRVALGFEQGMRALAEDWLPPMVHPARLADRELMDSLFSMVEAMTPEIHARQIHALLTRPNAGYGLADIHCQTLVLVGREDRWSPLAQHEEIASRIDKSRLVVVDDAGHFTPLERPDPVVEAMKAWLRT